MWLSWRLEDVHLRRSNGVRIRVQLGVEPSWMHVHGRHDRRHRPNRAGMHTRHTTTLHKLDRPDRDAETEDLVAGAVTGRCHLPKRRVELLCSASYSQSPLVSKRTSRWASSIRQKSSKLRASRLSVPTRVEVLALITATGESFGLSLVVDDLKMKTRCRASSPPSWPQSMRVLGSRSY